jgi:uncharacterized membrane protein YkvA (DUF1232 family)
MFKDWTSLTGLFSRFRLEELPTKEKILSAIARSAGKVPFTDDVLAMWYCARDPSTPSRVRAGIIGALAYLVLPTDLVPDVIFGLGFTDDAAVLTAVLALVGSNIKQEHRDKAKSVLLGDVEPTQDKSKSPIQPA